MVYMDDIMDAIESIGCWMLAVVMVRVVVVMDGEGWLGSWLWNERNAIET